MEHLLVRLLSHESYVIHMYSYVIHNKMMIKSYCNIYIYGYLVRWKSFTSNRSRSSRSSRSVASLTWPQCLASMRSDRKAVRFDEADSHWWSRTDPSLECWKTTKIPAILKGWRIFGDNEFHKSFNFQDCKKQVRKQVALLQYFCFQKVFSTTCNQVELELAKAGLASVKWIFVVVRSFPKIREKQQALLAVWSLVHWSLVRLWLASSLLHMSPEFSDRWLLGLRRLFGFVLSRGLFNEEFNDPPCWQNMAFACPEGACTQTRPAAKNCPLLRQYVNAVRQYVQMVSFPHLPCSWLPIHHFRVHPSQLG